MDVDDVGRWRFCPACAAPILFPWFPCEDPESDNFDFEEPRCSGCERPWIACSCEPTNAAVMADLKSQGARHGTGTA